jgi:hypothetical protein
LLEQMFYPFVLSVMTAHHQDVKQANSHGLQRRIEATNCPCCPPSTICRKVCGRYGLRFSDRGLAEDRPSIGLYPCSDSHFQNADGASTWMPRNGFKIKRS